MEQTPELKTALKHTGMMYFMTRKFLDTANVDITFENVIAFMEVQAKIYAAIELQNGLNRISSEIDDLTHAMGETFSGLAEALESIASSIDLKDI